MLVILLLEMARTLPTNKTKKNKQKNGKRSFSSLECQSSVSSSPKDRNFTAKEGDASKSSEMSKKAQCDLCKLSYSTEKVNVYAVNVLSFLMSLYS